MKNKTKIESILKKWCEEWGSADYEDLDIQDLKITLQDKLK